MPRRTIDSHPRRPYFYPQGLRATRAEHTHLEIDITDGKYRVFRRDDFSPFPARETVHWRGGTGISISFIDDAIEDETEVTIDVAVELDDLTDMNIVNPINLHVLRFDSGSAKWINTTLSGAGIAAAVHTHVAADVTDFDAAADSRIALTNVADLADVTISAIGANEILQWNGSAWINQTLTEAGISANTLIDNGVEGFRVDEASGHILIKQEAHTGLFASLNQTQGQGVLVSSLNEVATVSNANDVRTLPGAAEGLVVVVINRGANTLQIFPSSGDDLGNGVNISTTIPAGERRAYLGIDTTNWHGA